MVQSNIDNTASLIKLPDLPIPELTKMINEKVNQLAQEMSKNAAQDLIKHQQTLMSSMSSMIAKKSSETFNEMKTSIGQELSKLNTNVEVSLENIQKEMENKFLNSIGEKTGQTLTEAQSAIQNTIDKVGKGVEEIVKHIEEGEQYVNKQIKNLLDPLQRQIDSQTSKAKQLLSDQYNKMCEKVGENVGQNLAEKFNKAIIDAAHTQYQKIETAKSKAMNIAFSATQKAKLKIMSMTGISL
jgi:DNA anti-recombination protein RmuC